MKWMDDNYEINKSATVSGSVEHPIFIDVVIYELRQQNKVVIDM